MNEIIELCDGYSKMDKSDKLFSLLEPSYFMEKSTPIKCATPFKMIHKEFSDVAILALHGYQGYPGEMVYPSLKLYNAGFDVYCPRYPGHGVTKEDFNNTNSEDWITIARTSIGFLQREYREVYVMGHSMGGLISTIIAKEFDVKKLALIAPAFFIKDFSKTKIKLLKLFKDEIATPWEMDDSFWGICERDLDDDEYLGKTYWSVLNLKQIFELNKLREIALMSLDRVKSNTFCVIGDKDTAVDYMKVKKILKNKVDNSKIKILEDVNHLCQYFNNESKRNLCNDSIVEFFLDQE